MLLAESSRQSGDVTSQFNWLQVVVVLLAGATRRVCGIWVEGANTVGSRPDCLCMYLLAVQMRCDATV